MKKIILLLMLIGFAFADSTSVDTTAIEAKLVELEERFEHVQKTIDGLEKTKEHIAYTYRELKEMIEPKKEEVIE